MSQLSFFRHITSMIFIRIAISFLIFTPISALAKDELSYERFSQTALEQNLGLKIESAKVETFHANTKGLNIPPPMVGYMRMTDQSGSSADGFEVSQMLPFPTKTSHDRSARRFEAEAQNETLQAMESELRAKAKVLYVNLWVSQQRKNTLEEKRSAIQAHLRLARAGARSDSFLRVHLLKSESDLDLLENEIIAAEQDIVEKESSAAIFLNIDPADFHPVLQEPPVAPVPNESSLESPHQLESTRLILESLKARESNARSTWVPDLYLRYKEIGQTQLMPKTSEAMIGITLPFLFGDASANSGQASSQRLQGELEYEQAKRKIKADKSLLMTKAISLRKQLDNINQKLRPRAQKRMKLVHNIAPRDMETLQDHREAMEVFPDLKLKSLDLREQYEGTIAELLKYDRGAK